MTQGRINIIDKVNGVAREGALYADAAYSSKETRDKLEQLGIADQVQRKGYRNKQVMLRFQLE